MSSVESVGRGVLALAAVLFVIWVLTRAVGRRQKRTGHVVDVLGRTQLSRHASIAVVRIGGRDVVVGVTEGGVSLLGDVDGLRTPQPVETGTATAAPAPAPAAGPAPRVLQAVPGPAARVLQAVPGPAARHQAPSTAGPLTGSALSPATWKQSVEALRTLTVRSHGR